jgi:putative acetyltransferase
MGVRMKIRKVNEDYQSKVLGLLRLAFPKSNEEENLVKKLYENEKPIHEWVCLHTNKVVAYVAFTQAFHEKEVVGFHLAPLAVKPGFQNQGIGSMLVNFTLRQEPLKSSPIYVLGSPGYYQKFGFKLCELPICPFDEDNKHFLAIRNEVDSKFTIGYEKEFIN